ncbi:MAG: TIGR02444 family protein [Caulobacteraceae bacterium]
MSLNDWARTVYTRPSVEAVLLELQDHHGQCVSYLLWAAWTACEGRALEGPILIRGADLARSWERSVVSHLRAARRALKIARIDMTDVRRETVRAMVKSAEFDAEHALLESLEKLSPALSQPSHPLPALTAAIGVWTRNAPSALVRQLADLLAGEADAGVSVLMPERSRSADDAEDTNSEAGVRSMVAALRTEHHDLDDAIRALTASPLPDIIQIARLKKRKLILRDQIAQLEDRLIPDDIA